MIINNYKIEKYKTVGINVLNHYLIDLLFNWKLILEIPEKFARQCYQNI